MTPYPCLKSLDKMIFIGLAPSGKNIFTKTTWRQYLYSMKRGHLTWEVLSDGGSLLEKAQSNNNNKSSLINPSFSVQSSNWIDFIYLGPKINQRCRPAKTFVPERKTNSLNDIFKL